MLVLKMWAPNRVNLCLVALMGRAKLVGVDVRRVCFITGTDTGVGKTVLTVLLTRQLRAQGCHVFAVKPFCTGGREDAEALLAAQGAGLSLDEINPWHFRAAVTPLVAARQERRRVTLSEAIGFLRSAEKRCEVLLVEGAGGLLSPLGEDFCLRELIRPIRGIVLVVCPNRLGAINQSRLVFSALSPSAATRAQLVLMDSAKPDASCETNPQILATFLGRDRIHRIPWLAQRTQAELNRRLVNRTSRLLRRLNFN